MGQPALLVHQNLLTVLLVVVEDAVPVDNLYVTKYNMGDNGLPIPSTVLVMTVGTQCNAQKCCWKGTTANPCQNKNSSSNGGYSGCNRTVCNWYAANEICANYTAAGKTWRLPNYSEMSNWYNYTVSEGASGPQICDDYNSKTTATQCYCNYGNCPGSNDGCRPGFIWAQQYNAYSAYASFLNYGGWYYPHSSRDKTYAYSVRCVTAIDYS